MKERHVLEMSTLGARGICGDGSYQLRLARQRMGNSSCPAYHRQNLGDPFHYCCSIVPTSDLRPACQQNSGNIRSPLGSYAVCVASYIFHNTDAATRLSTLRFAPVQFRTYHVSTIPWDKNLVLNYFFRISSYQKGWRSFALNIFYESGEVLPLSKRWTHYCTLQPGPSDVKACWFFICFMNGLSERTTLYSIECLHC